MNIYDDYGNYIGECEELITKMKETNSSVLVCLNDVILVMDYIYRKHMDNVKIDNDQEEIFDLGFGYLSSTLGDLRTYYEDYFNKDIKLFNKYAHLITYAIYIEDLKGFLDGEELLTEERLKVIDQMQGKIDVILSNCKNVDEKTIEYIEAGIEEVMPKVSQFKPVYVVFSMMAEELNLY